MAATLNAATKITAASIVWSVVASDGTLYTTLALMAAASKVAWPGLDPGQFIQTLAVKSELNNAAGGDGSPAYICFNQSLVTADTQGIEVSGSGQTLVFDGMKPPNSVKAIWNVWVRKTVSTDYLTLFPT